jgi:polyphosphate kinase
VTALGPRERLWEILDICLRDQRQAWLLHSDGCYAQLCSESAGEVGDAIATHVTLMELARRRSHPLPK